MKLSFLVYLTLSRPIGKRDVPVDFNSNIIFDMKICIRYNMQKYKHYQIYQNLKLPGELEMAFTTAISSSSLFVAGKKQNTNPSEKMTRRSRPHKLIET